MVILFSKHGQLANRLWQAAHFIANAREYNYRLIHVGFGEYSEYFRESLVESGRNTIKIDKNRFSSFERFFLWYSNLSQKLERRINQRLPFIEKINFLEFSEKRYNLRKPSFLKLLKRNITLVDGWFFADDQSLAKHADYIRQLFRPNDIYSQNVKKLKEDYFGLFDLVVGVHIRRGDYKEYRNGAWFYSDEEYAQFMDKVLALPIFCNKKIAFFICSNEPVNFPYFNRYNVIQSTNNFVEDLYALSECDYIIGPPSTYSAWASFYGNVPLHSVADKNKKFEENCFQVFARWSS